MAFKTSEKYKSVIYSGDCRHKLKLLFNGVELDDADVYCESLKVTSRILPNGSTRFSLDNFIAKEAEIILHDIDTTIIQSPVNISIGTLVEGTYEYVPIGLFVVQDLPTTDKNKTTIKLRDYAVKFDFGYNAKPLIDENGGSVTKLQILQDICNKAGVETDITKFYGSNSKIGIYDNSITARTYISYLAEQAGAIATIDRSGKLIFVQLKDLETVEIPLNIVEKYEDGEKYEISRVVYEDAIRKFEYGDESKDTLFINTANPYITNDVLTGTLTGSKIETSDSADAEVVNYKQYGITKQDGTPTPDTPVEIEVATGSVSAKSTGKNLLDTDILSYSFEANTNGYVQGGNIGFGKVTLNANTKYYISYDVVETGTTNLRNTAMLVASDGTGSEYQYQYIGNHNTTTGIKVWEFTPAKTKEYIVNYWCNASDKKVTIANMMVSTNSATEYEPYKESSITYNLGDNFFADKDYIENGVLNKHIGKFVVTNGYLYVGVTWKGYVVNIPDKLRRLNNYLVCDRAIFDKLGNKIENTVYENVTNVVFVGNADDTLETLQQKFNGAIIYYKLAKPEQIQLETTGELRTFEPNTIITNSLDSEMEVEYARNQTQVSQILELNKDIPLNSFKTGKIIGNPAIDAYDIIKIVDGDKEFKTLATNDLTYNGVMINTFDTQIGKEAKKENVTLTPEATFKKWAKTEIDNVEAEVKINTGNIQTVKDEMGNMYTKGQVNELVANAETGVTNTFSEAGGNNIFRNTGLWFENDGEDKETNPYEFWNGKGLRESNDRASNNNSILLQNGSLSQEQEVPNGNYSISFWYKKLISQSVASVVINDKEYQLNSTDYKQFYTGEKDNETNEYITEPIVVTSGHLKIQFKCNANGGIEVYDLMANKGSVKLAYSQNENETTTETVNISKGITITSSNMETIFKANANGIRILTLQNEIIAYFTDKGLSTKELTVENKAQVCGTLVSEVGDQTWFTKM